MDSSQQINANNEERLLGMFSHLSIFFGGIILPIIFWAINKDKSKFVTFHSLQALFFHIAYAVILIIVIFSAVFGGLGLSFLTAGAHTFSKSSPPVILIVAIIVMYGLIFITLFFFIGYSIYMGIKAYQGELKKYPIIGSIIYKKVYGATI
jgi:uncharacterized Tic20 family protein